ALISSYVKSRSLSCKTIYYEDLVADAKNTLNFILPELIQDQSFVKSTMKKQSSNTNENWAERFSHEHFERSKKNIVSRGIKFFEDSSKHIINKSLSSK
ncbi:Stf0 family sulfotransferase, partial [bacterium]|nr:Stf0 family sulfotransferase [bacterium]